MRRYVLWGATGQALVLHEALPVSEWQLVALFDRSASVQSPFEGVPLFTGEEGFKQWLADGQLETWGLAAIGGARGSDRLAVQAMFKTAGLKIATVVHARAWVARDATLGEGCQVLAQAAVGSRARLGDACIVNTSASVDHECVLGHGVHVCPGAHLAGCVEVGDGVMIGTGASVLPRIKIGAGAIVGAGAVVTRDVAPGVTVVGNPGRVLKS